MHYVSGHSWQRLLLLLLGGVLFVLFGWCFRPEQRSYVSIYLEKIKTACAEDMVRNACTVMSNGALKAGAEKISLVFIAGVGAIDANSYRELYEAGDEMCTVVVKRCEVDWDSQQCRIARKIYLKSI